MSLIKDTNSAGESILVINNPYNYSNFEHPDISIKIKVEKPDGTNQELMDQKGVFNLGKLDNGTYDVKIFSVSNNSQLTPPNNQSVARIDSFEITDTTSSISSGTTPSTTPSTTPGTTPSPSTPGRLGSALGLAAGTKITGDFVSGFQTEATSVMNGLSDITKLSQEVTNLLDNWPEVSTTVTTKFNSKKITDNELKGLATNITTTLSELEPLVGTPADELLDKFTPDDTVKLATIILAYNVKFPQETKGLPTSGSGTPLDKEETVIEIDKEEEDREAALKAEAAQLETMVRKGEKDMTGLINLLTQPVQDENAENKKKLVLSQLQHTISDFENFKSHLAKTGHITVQENNLSKVKEMKEKIATLTEKQPIAMPAGWNAELFKPVKGIGKFKEYESQLKKVNDLIDRQNDKRKEITKAAEDIDTNKLTTHFGRITKIRLQVEDFDNELKALQQQLSTTTDAKQLAPIFTKLGKLLQDNYKDIKLERQEILLFEKDIFGLIKSMAKITKHNGKMRGITGWFEHMTHGKSGTLPEESKKLEDEREYLEKILKEAKEIATPTPTPVPTLVPAPPTITPEANIFPESPNVPLKETEILKTISINSDKLYGTFTRTESIGGANKSPQQVLQELSKEGPIDITQIANIMKRMHSLRSKRIYKKDITNLRGDLIALERYLQPAYELLHNLHRTEKATNKGKMDKKRTKGATTARANRIGDLIRQTRALMVQVNQYIKENS